jgi:glycosyltransferase involved in cell wall biosynthesis
MNDYKTISFIVPTIGRESLKKTVESIETWPGDELLVIQHNPPSNNWGNAERQEGTDKAKCDYLAFIDDDDMYVPGHRQIMDNALRENINDYPIMFKMKYPSGRILWEIKKIRCGNIGAPMFLVPNRKECFHIWEPYRSAADFIFADKWHWPAKLTIWRDEIIALPGKDDLKWLNKWDYTESAKHNYKTGKAQ